MGRPPESYADATIGLFGGNEEKAQRFFAARQQLDATTNNEDKDKFDLALFARLDAALGRKDQAIREGHGVQSI